MCANGGRTTCGGSHPAHAAFPSAWVVGPSHVSFVAPLLIPLVFVLAGPVEGPVDAQPQEAPAALALQPDAPVDAMAGWRGVAGAAGGMALGVGVPLAVLGAGSGTLAFMFSQAAAGTLLGVGPALFAVATVSTMLGAAACLPPLGALLATAGAVWGAQQEGRDPMMAFLGGAPGMALGATSLVLAGVAAGFGIGGFTFAIPWIITVTAAVLIGLPAPFIAFVGASLADAMGAPIAATVRRGRDALGVPADDPAMAY